MSMKTRLTRKHIILIVLVAILIVTIVAGSAVYARYSQTAPAGTLSVQIQKDSNSNAVEIETYDSQIQFDRIHPVYPFG